MNGVLVGIRSSPFTRHGVRLCKRSPETASPRHPDEDRAAVQRQRPKSCHTYKGQDRRIVCSRANSDDVLEPKRRSRT